MGDTKLDDKAVESFRAMSGVSGVTPMMNFPYNVTARAGAGGRYLYDYVQIMGIDMTQFDQMGYKLVGGEKPVKKDQVLAGEWFAYGFMDTLKNGEQRTSTRGGQYSSCTFDQTTGQCEEDQDEDPFFDPLATQISLTTGTNYQGDQYTMNMYGGGGGTGGAGGNTAGQSENVTFDVRASGIVAGDYNKGYATSDGLVMDLQALKELAAKVDPAAAKKATAYNQVLVKAADLKSVPEVESQIKALGYETSSYEDMRKSLEEQSRAIQLILGGIGAVSLLVAAIGIANTMVMSVTERTREIGIMKILRRIGRLRAERTDIAGHQRCRRVVCGRHERRHVWRYGQRCRRGLRRRYRWRNIYLDHTLAGDSWWRECDPLFGDSVVAVPVRRTVFHADRLAVRLRPGQ